MKEIAAHPESVTGTGGGPCFQLKAVYYKMYTPLVEKDNPSVAGVEIPDSIDSETVKLSSVSESSAGDLQLLKQDAEIGNQVHMHLLEQEDLSNTPGPSTPFPSDQPRTLGVEGDFDSGNSSPACTSHQLVTYRPSSSRTKLPSRSLLASADTSLDKNKRLKATPMSVNQVVRKTKFTVCEDTATSASYHAKERRLKVLLLAIQVRCELGAPSKNLSSPMIFMKYCLIWLTNCSCITHEHWDENNFQN